MVVVMIVGVLVVVVVVVFAMVVMVVGVVSDTPHFGYKRPAPCLGCAHLASLWWFWLFRGAVWVSGGGESVLATSSRLPVVVVVGGKGSKGV